MKSEIPQYEHFDPRQIRDIADNDTELMLEIINVFMESNPDNIKDLKMAINSGDHTQVEFAGHKLIGAFRLIGAERLALYAEELATVRNDALALVALFEKIKNATEQLMMEIGNYVERLNS